MSKTILTFVDDLYEDLELWYPELRSEEAGYDTRLAALELKTFRGKHGYPANGLLIPGGFMPENCDANRKRCR